jgi:hypothetical protein
MLARVRVALKFGVPLLLVGAVAVVYMMGGGEQPMTNSGVAFFGEGRCSFNDKRILDKYSDDVPAPAAHCAKKSLSWLKVVPEKYIQCFKSEAAPISDSCASCYANMASFAVNNCKFVCLKSWCSTKCLKCKRQDDKTMEACTGYKMEQFPRAKPCDDAPEALE